MNLAKISTNGQITIPVEIRKALDVKSGDKIVFTQNEHGYIIVQNLKVKSIMKVQPTETSQWVG